MNKEQLIRAIKIHMDTITHLRKSFNGNVYQIMDIGKNAEQINKLSVRLLKLIGAKNV